MRIPRLFVDAALVSGADIRLAPEDAHYLVHVLRLKPGAELVLFSGRGGEYRAVLSEIRGKSAVVTVGEFSAREAESALFVRLAQGISRGERMDYTVQKAVELGVTEIVPPVSERCAVNLDGPRTEKRLSHWQKVAASACAQCGRNRVPRVLPVQDLERWLRSVPGNIKLVLDPQATKGLASIPRGEEITLLIGPEGGLSEAELVLAQQVGFTGVRLGPRILCTETAAVAALTAIQALWGDLGEDYVPGE
jgi:16S rRNA (uracil1498-N3)-methyltransferase